MHTLLEVVSFYFLFVRFCFLTMMQISSQQPADDDAEMSEAQSSPDPITISFVPSLPEELTGDLETRLTEKPFDSRPVSSVTSRSDASSPTPTRKNPSGVRKPQRKRTSTMRWNPVNPPALPAPPAVASSSSQAPQITYTNPY